jgi:hypothetical protein
MKRTHKNTHNPVLPLDVFIPDSEGHVMPDGRLYIYGSFDDREDVFCSEKYYVVSTSDFKEWEISDVAMRGEQVPWFNDPDAPKYPGIDWSHPTPFIQKMLSEAAAGKDDMKEKFEKAGEEEKPSLLFAPDCICRDGKYYLYFCMSDDSEGVAVSDDPNGPFTDPVQLPCGGIDPAVFIDDDGSAYYYWGQLFSHGVRLNDDMRSFDRNAVVDDLVTEEEHYFHEGSSMRKIGDTYYYVFCNIEHGKPTSLGYATGKSPLGPFTYRGVIIDNAPCDPASWNNHGSIECVNGQWYVFYHRCSRGVQQHRRLCIEKINILDDGTIPEVKMTSQGPGEPFGPGEKIMGYQACEVYGGCFIDIDAAYGEKLTKLTAGSRAVFRYVRSAHRFGKIDLAASGSGKIILLMNEKKAGEIIVKDGMVTKSRFAAEAGEYELTLVVESSENLEIFEITLQ